MVCIVMFLQTYLLFPRENQVLDQAAAKLDQSGFVEKNRRPVEKHR